MVDPQWLLEGPYAPDKSSRMAWRYSIAQSESRRYCILAQSFGGLAGAVEAGLVDVSNQALLVVVELTGPGAGRLRQPLRIGRTAHTVR